MSSSGSEPRGEATADTGVQDPPRRERLGRYLELHLLGSGGMGAVYRAYDPSLERMVAIKLIRQRPGGDTPGSGRKEGSETFLQRFRREARAMARLSHPN